GQPVPGAEAKLVEGELLVKGPMVVPGYWRDPAATAEAIEDGWLRTGDLARIDEDGFVYVLDRKKDMIMRGGYKIFSARIVRILVDHPAVREAAVVGVADELFFQEVLAAIVVEPGAAVTE